MSSFRFPFVLMAAISLAGCGPRTVSSSSTTASTKSEGNEANAKALWASTEDVLARALLQLQPESFGLYSNTDKPVSLLNTWRQKKNEHAADEVIPVHAPEGWQSQVGSERLAQAKYDLPDAYHIRDALLYHTIAGYLSDRARDEVLRVNAVVEFVCRNVSLWKDDETDLPLQPYLALQLGRGSAEDRAWICTEILRQLRLDTVIIRCTSDSKARSDKWLFGVLVEQKVYLYDLVLGLSLPGADGVSTCPLSEIVNHAEWLEALATTKPYRMTVADLQHPEIFVVPASNFWCQRMHDLEQILPAQDNCVLYDPLILEGDKKGLLQRIAANGKWSMEELKPWPYPQQQAVAAAKVTPEAQQEMLRLQQPFLVPFPFSLKDDKPVAGTPERKLQKFRTDQLMGKFAEATQRYLSIRHLEVEQYPPDLERLNRFAAEDAIYWTGVCKFEMGDYEKAMEPIAEALKKYDRKGKWFFPARLLLAQCQAELKQYSAAVKTLERTSSDDPYRESNAIRVKRWTAAAAK